MNHPELLVVPVLMLADYGLTILGAKMSAVVYRKHFVTASYELNPLWRTSVDRVRWINPRHMASVVLVAAMLVLVDRMFGPTDAATEFLFAVLLGAYGSICGRHLTNVLLFRYLNRHPQEISGQVQLSMKLAVRISQFAYIGLVPLFVLIAVFVPGAFSVGVLAGLLSVILAHIVWSGRGASSEAFPDESVEGEARPIQKG